MCAGLSFKHQEQNCEIENCLKFAIIVSAFNQPRYLVPAPKKFSSNNLLTDPALLPKPN
jgi:hypothetical protein